jgi:hypothetical protein
MVTQYTDGLTSHESQKKKKVLTGVEKTGDHIDERYFPTFYCSPLTFHTHQPHLGMNPPRVLCRVQAIYAYQSGDPSALSFAKGDIIEVLTQLESGWWDGWYVRKLFIISVISVQSMHCYSVLFNYLKIRYILLQCVLMLFHLFA